MKKKNTAVIYIIYGSPSLKIGKLGHVCICTDHELQSSFEINKWTHAHAIK